MWGLTAGVATWQIRRAMTAALAVLDDLPDWADGPLVAREGWPGFAAALRALHAPTTLPGPAPRLRLAYDEAFAQQVAYGLNRLAGRRDGGRAVVGTGALCRQALARFGHAPTLSQTEAIAQITADMAAPHRMRRLLQGDVGSGKTLVAMLAMLTAAEAGYQAVLMAPTEILARQHLRSMRALSPVGVELLAGSVKGPARARIVAGLESGAVRLVVGTHALFQSGVVFRDLALAVVDEQHRFGVDQRLSLAGKGSLTDLLVMTATPIPRTVELARYGDMEVTHLRGKPAGRQPIRTTLHSLDALGSVVDAVGRQLEAGARVYWVCPLVEESDQLDVAAAEARYAGFRTRFGTRVGIVHGRQDAAVREATLAAFASGRLRLLVATTVVEVGVDVSDATVMVIDSADRFGLAQLHQLRGRVGRGGEPSFCLLLHDAAIAEPARRRLCLIRDTEDGFAIADADYEWRGAGEALGTAQSGQVPYRLMDAQQQGRLVELAHSDARVLLDADPGLASPRGQAVRGLLALFGRGIEGARLAAG